MEDQTGAMLYACCDGIFAIHSRYSWNTRVGRQFLVSSQRALDAENATLRSSFPCWQAMIKFMRGLINREGGVPGSKEISEEMEKIWRISFSLALCDMLDKLTFSWWAVHSKQSSVRPPCSSKHGWVVCLVECQRSNMGNRGEKNKTKTGEQKNNSNSSRHTTISGTLDNNFEGYRYLND